MVTDPNSQIELSAAQRAKLAELSDRTGKPWSELLSEMLRSYAISGEPGEQKSRFGSGKGLLEMTDDFDAPLPDFQDYM